MKIFEFATNYLEMLADTVTPVSIYLHLRDKFANTILLESTDYHSSENSFSYICCKPIASFKVEGLMCSSSFPDGVLERKKLDNRPDALAELQAFSNRFEVVNNAFKFINHGLFGYMSYDAVQYMEDINFDNTKDQSHNIPEIYYQVYQYVIAIDHFKNALFLFEHLIAGELSTIDEIATIIKSRDYPYYPFKRVGQEQANLTDEAYLSMVTKGIAHCRRGDVFQIVLSRRFEQQFTGDEFNVYRMLRSINPSPYLFYFDFGNFKIFGSSPETQIAIKNKTATIYPIAGTFKRTGNDEKDAQLARDLKNDPKENAEHTMLVDLARNDLSRHGKNVTVPVYREIQYYSHLIHLVSKVSGELLADASVLQVVGDTFPAGTLSGAPKYRAMELIDEYEHTKRSYYAGAIGFFGFNNDFMHAIMIRSFLSKNNKLYYQAGAGIVAKSVPKSELEEVNNKLAALRKALILAENRLD